MKLTDKFRTELEEFRIEQGLSRANLATLLHISPQMCSEVLNGTKTLSAETLLQAQATIQILRKNSMNTQSTNEGLDLVNEGVLKPYQNNGTRILHLSSALTDGS